MKKPVLPPPDSFASCPQAGSVLDYYAGVFSAVYVTLSPFLAPVSAASLALFDSSDPEADPSRMAVAAHFRPVRWRDVAQACGLPNLAAVDIALRTGIHGLAEVYRNEDHLARVRTLYASDGLLPPTEGQHSELLQDEVLRLFQELGHDWVWVGDEFCAERQLYRIDDIRNGAVDPFTTGCNVFAPDQSLLWTVHWDSHFSFLCAASEAALKSVQIEARLEGFFCRPGTDVYWSTTRTGPE